jgi:NADPH-dependent glutamate synthase beta subunit-like oxidoreductase
VLVLGGGNVAIDAAMSAVRLGASWVGMSCLESRETMPSHDWEVRDAEQEGIQIYPSRTFKEITSESGRGNRSAHRPVWTSEVSWKGGLISMSSRGQEEILPAEVVVFAIGQRPDIACLGDQVETVRGRFPNVDGYTLATNLPGVFAGGDVVTGTAFIVDAIAAGHKAARSIDRYLQGLELDPMNSRPPALHIEAEEVHRQSFAERQIPSSRDETPAR